MFFIFNIILKIYWENCAKKNEIDIVNIKIEIELHKR
jgi:hypothetical protein